MWVRLSPFKNVRIKHSPGWTVKVVSISENLLHVFFCTGQALLVDNEELSCIINQMQSDLMTSSLRQPGTKFFGLFRIPEVSSAHWI